ncbi:MAG: NAD(P)H-dependent glycerol-3-phosphate dehydrogenase [Gemmatimonadota bacterium]
MTAIAVLGAGSWGTTLADLLTRKGHAVRLWAHEAEVAAAINERHLNDLFLPGCPLSEALRASAAIADVVAEADHVVCVAPSHVARRVLSAARPTIRPGAILVSATKGIETETLDLMSDVAGQVLPNHRFVALSGPSFAREVYHRQPTAVAAASDDGEAAATVQQMLSTATFRVYSNRDVIGTELAGALKNVIAIAAGILDGLGLGNNSRAALITRGLAEISRLGAALGADPRTFAGLAGMGDLILTTCGALSRNRSLGVAIAEGVTLDQHTRDHRSVAEGVNSARAAVRLAARHGVELPICEQVHGVLFGGIPPADAIGALMGRTLKAE